MLNFESQCEKLGHKKCDFCRSVSMQLKITNTPNVKACSSCITNKCHKDNSRTPLLPIWYNDNNEPQYQLPAQLIDLREAEKLLISMVSVYVPVHHLSIGQLGCKGHVCCFQKNLTDLCTTLRRIPTDISVIRVLQKFKNTDGEVTLKAFSIRRKKCLMH